MYIWLCSLLYFVECRARRAAKEAKEAPAQPAPEKVKVEVKKFVKIGRPGYKGRLICVLLVIIRLSKDLMTLEQSNVMY